MFKSRKTPIGTFADIIFSFWIRRLIEKDKERERGGRKYGFNLLNVKKEIFETF